MPSIIIPAHNEAAVIGRLLEDLTRSATREQIEIVVGCNGCSDITADICRRFDFPVKVVETDTASKIAGLNLADSAATRFPRFYVDADVQISLDAIHAVSEVLSSGSALAAAPQMHVDYSKSSWAVKAFYRIWLILPYHREGMIGSGVYALSKRGRDRFGTFPEIIADDGYVRALFSGDERITLDSCHFTITAPTNVRDLIRVKTRSRLGFWELGKRFPQTLPNEKKNWLPAIGRFIRTPGLWIDGVAYLTITILVRIRAKQKFKNLSSYRWERDESSRLEEKIED